MGTKVGAGSLVPQVPHGATGPGVGKQTRVDAALQPVPSASVNGGQAVEPASDATPQHGQIGLLLATPAQPLGDPLVNYLLGLPVPALLSEFVEAIACGYHNPLERRLAMTVGAPILMAALQCADIVQRSQFSPADPALHRAGAALDQVSITQQVAILEWMVKQRGVSITAMSLVEGAIAMKSSGEGDQHAQDGTTVGAQADGAAVGAQSLGMPSPVEMGEWTDPPQPPELYVGTEVHDAIGRHYIAAHPGQPVVANTTPIGSILKLFNSMSPGSADAAALDENDRSLRPDILNLKLRHLYEIKPRAALAMGVAKMENYCSLLARAGVIVLPGPMREPGTSGALPAPAGTVRFECIQPGVITYEYRKSKLIPIPVPFPVGARARKNNPKWKWEFEADLTPEQKKALVTTTVGGAMLILLMVVLAPVGA